MYAFDCRIASSDCNKTHNCVNPISDPKCKIMVSVTVIYCFPILDGEWRYYVGSFVKINNT